MDEEESWDPVEREAVSDVSFHFLEHYDYALNLWDMLIGTG